MSDEYNSRMERRKAESKPKNKKKKLFKRIILYCVIAILLLLIACGVWTTSIIMSAPELTSEKLQTPFSSQIYDQDGELVTTLFKEQNRMKVDIGDVPDQMIEAVTSIEDRRFFQHNGVDIRRIVGALIANIENGWGSEGGSTVTQQVVKRTILSPEKTLTRKIQEAYLAIRLEQTYPKDEILQMYLNNIYFGNGAYGLATASKTYFGTKDLSGLNVSQMALLAGLPNAPSYYDPFQYPERATDRRDQVLQAMLETGAISENQAKEAESVPVKKLVQKQKKINNDKDRPYQAFVDRVYHELVNKRKVVTDQQFYQGGLMIHTTLDTNAQKEVYDLLTSDKINYPDKAFEAGISLIDTKTGAIQAIGGGRDFLSIGDTNYGAEEKNPPGSTFKPIVDYGPAIEHLSWSTNHSIVDEPYSYSDGTPINEWDGEYWGSMTIRRALAWSRNIPALKTFQAVGKEKAAEFADQLGIELQKPIPEAAAIGGLSRGVTPLQMAGAYAAFGNEGVYHDPYTVKKIVFQNGNEKKLTHDPIQAMHAYTAYMITDMLKTVITSGTGTAANIPGIPVAGKTGSTNIPEPLRQQHNIGDGLLDSWFAGYTTQYTAAVWTGYPKLKNGDDVQYIRYDGSEDIAKEIFQVLMESLSDPETPDFKKPDSVGGSGDTLYVRETQPAMSGSGNDEQQEDEHTDQQEPEQPVQEERENKQEQKREEQRQNNSSDQDQQKDPKDQKDEEQKNTSDQGQQKDPKDQQGEEQKNQRNEEQQDQNKQKNQDQEEDETDKQGENSKEQDDQESNSEEDENDHQDENSKEQDDQESNPDEGNDQNHDSGDKEDQDNSEKVNNDGESGENSAEKEKNEEDHQSSQTDDTR
ncbi:transglycosylase domain-containing protein [Lentibacillus jeotgali]|uniref:transglycosylase domain-containing protein n=1 Tax=Lentibacillus jeotgali TaxID=558169 RepID=UPI0002627CAC|nr:PBP1A family penicillin-binding protein [Lentibacillus jeotgali]